MYKDHTNEEITSLYHKIATELSYMNAAEGQAWRMQSIARNDCQKKYQEICNEFKIRSLPIPQGDYLI